MKVVAVLLILPLLQGLVYCEEGEYTQPQCECECKCAPERQDSTPSDAGTASPNKTPAAPLSGLLDAVGNLLNLPKGALSKLPLPTGKPSVEGPRLPVTPLPLCRLTLPQLKSLIAILSTQHAIGKVIPLPPISTQQISPNQVSYEAQQQFSAQQQYAQQPQYPPQPQQSAQICESQQPQVCEQPQPQVCEQPQPQVCEQVYPPQPTQIYSNSIENSGEQVNCQEEKIIKQVPVVQKIMRSILETRTKHIPVIKKRLRTVVEPYTSHVAVLEKYLRPVEETIVRTIPVVERRIRPVNNHQGCQQCPVEQGSCPIVGNYPQNGNQCPQCNSNSSPILYNTVQEAPQPTILQYPQSNTEGPLIPAAPYRCPHQPFFRA